MAEKLNFKNKIVLGLTENVTIFGDKDSSKVVVSRIDTGATKSSICQRIAAELRLGPIIKNSKIKQSNGAVTRPVIEVDIELLGKKMTTEFNISNRDHMTYEVLIGQDILKQGFIIDPNKSD